MLQSIIIKNYKKNHFFSIIRGRKNCQDLFVNSCGDWDCNTTLVVSTPGGAYIYIYIYVYTVGMYAYPSLMVPIYVYG